MLPVDAGALLPDELAWMRLRGRVALGRWWVDAPCRHLTAEGACAIYQTRPQACRDYLVEGPACNLTRKADKADPEGPEK